MPCAACPVLVNLVMQYDCYRDFRLVSCHLHVRLPLFPGPGLPSLPSLQPFVAVVRWHAVLLALPGFSLPSPIPPAEQQEVRYWLES
jgi:hypothetical protein